MRNEQAVRKEGKDMSRERVKRNGGSVKREEIGKKWRGANKGESGKKEEMAKDKKVAKREKNEKITKELKTERNPKIVMGQKMSGEKTMAKKKNAARENAARENAAKVQQNSPCPVFSLCGGCQYLHLSYDAQLHLKQRHLQKLLDKFAKVHPVVGMENPFHYRNKVHAVFGYQKGEVVSGVYQEGSHSLVPVERCMIEDEKADEIIGTIRGMLKSFKIRTYDEDRGYGLLRHVLVRRGFATGEIMVVLVTASPIFPSKNNFVKELLRRHPEITTIIQNINERDTSMVLGEREFVLFGKGYIEDVLCGFRFRISPQSFYQINPVQTERLYDKAISLAGLTGREVVLDAYCGIGTIGIIAAGKARQVIGVELNRDAVRDAVKNARLNKISNIQFYCNDATEFMAQMAADGEQVDVVLMDPPRTGSTEEFIKAVGAVKARKVVYVSCGPDALARDLAVFESVGYKADGIWGYDLFPGTGHTECVVWIQRKHM